MRTKNAGLRKMLSLLLAAFTVSLSMNTEVFADNTTNSGLHVGAASLLRPLLGDVDEDVETSAGAALFLDGEEVLVADKLTVSANSAITADAQEVPELVMANVQNSVNVRAEASEEAESVGKLFKNCGGVILDQKDGWTYLQSGELKGWAKNDYLLFGEQAEALRKEVGTLKATVNTDVLRVRKEADVESGVYGILELDQKITVVEDGDEWVAVKFDKDTVGYVAAEYVDVAYEVEAGKTSQQLQREELAKQAKEKEKQKAQKEKEKKKLTKNRGAVSVGVDDVTLLAALIQCEAGRECYEGQLAVGAVVMNRVRSGGYPNSISAVITAPAQFPPATNGKVSSVVASGPSASCIRAAQEAIAGASNVGGATHFRAASSGANGIVIGNHVFW